MPAEEFNYTGLDVEARVRSSFGDTSGAQLGDGPILNWINDGQREIVNSNPILRDTKVTNVVKGQSDYTFPADKVMVIEAIYISGYPLTNLSPQEARAFIRKQDPELASSAQRPEIWYERAGVITLYPVPDTNITNGMKLEFIKNPTPLAALSETLSVPDRYFNELVAYVTAQALEMDENYEAASYKISQFREGLNRQNTKDSISQSELYSGVLSDPIDFL